MTRLALVPLFLLLGGISPSAAIPFPKYHAITARQGHPQVDITPLAKPVPMVISITPTVSVVEASGDISASLDREESSVSASTTSTPGGEAVPTPTAGEVALSDASAVHDPPAEAKVDPAGIPAPSPSSECPIAAEGESITIAVTETASATATAFVETPALSAESLASSAHIGQASVGIATKASESSVINTAIQYPPAPDTASFVSFISTASVASETISASAPDASTASAEESSLAAAVPGVVPDGVEGSDTAGGVDAADVGVGMEEGTAAPAVLVVEGGVGSNATETISEVGPIEVVDSETGAIDLEAGPDQDMANDTPATEGRPLSDAGANSPREGEGEGVVGRGAAAGRGRGQGRPGNGGEGGLGALVTAAGERGGGQGQGRGRGRGEGAAGRDGNMSDGNVDGNGNDQGPDEWREHGGQGGQDDR